MKWPICRPKLLHGLVYVYFICIYVATIATRVNYTLPYRNLSNYNYLYFICTEYKFIMFICVNSLNDDRCCLDNTTRVDLWDRLDTSVESCSWEKWGVRHECRVSNSTRFKYVRFELELSLDTIFAIIERTQGVRKSYDMDHVLSNGDAICRWNVGSVDYNLASYFIVIFLR